MKVKHVNPEVSDDNHHSMEGVEEQWDQRGKWFYSECKAPLEQRNRARMS